MSSRIIWEREIDHEVIAERQKRFVRLFGIFAAFCLLAGLIFTSFKNTLGIALVLLIVGFFLGTWVRFSSLSDQANPTMSITDGSLVMGRLSIPVSDIECFTTLATSMQTSVFGDRSRIRIGKALFRLRTSGKRQPETVEFGWPKMGEGGVEGVREALEAEFPDQWVTPEFIIGPPSKPRRPSRRHL